MKKKKDDYQVVEVTSIINGRKKDNWITTFNSDLLLGDVNNYFILQFRIPTL